MKGAAGIFGFPFRMHATLDIPSVQGKNASGTAKFRAHTPFTARSKGSPLSPFPSFESWPAFGWSPQSAQNQRLAPPKDLGTTFFGETAYDAMRVDAWSQTPEVDLQLFTKRFLQHLRILSGQSWVGAYEFQTDHSLKFTFPVDLDGFALETPYCGGSFLSPPAWTKPINGDLFQKAFSSALGDTDPLLYWSLFLDANNDFARGGLATAFLGLALSIEVARNTCFPRFAKTEMTPDLGEVLRPPFDGTDLLRHLSTALAQTVGRNLRQEQPGNWLNLKQLYIARHHIAHGKPPVFPTPQGLRRANEEDYVRWQDAAFGIISWIEAL